MRDVPLCLLGMAAAANRLLFSRRLKSFPGIAVSEQVMVRLFPSTTVTGPTGSLMTIWATETPNTPKYKVVIRD